MAEAGCERCFINHPLLVLVRRVLRHNPPPKKNIVKKKTKKTLTSTVMTEFNSCPFQFSVKIIKETQGSLAVLFSGCNASKQSITKPKLFSKRSIKQVRSPRWHRSSGLDTLGFFLARWIRGCLYFTRGPRCFFPLLTVISPRRRDANFPTLFSKSDPFLSIPVTHFYISRELANRHNDGGGFKSCC